MLKYSDLTNRYSSTYFMFQRHYESFEKRERQLEREKEIIFGLIDKMEELGEITLEQYQMVIKCLIHTDSSWDRIMESVFKEE